MRLRRRAGQRVTTWCLVCIVMQVWAAIKNMPCGRVKEACQSMSMGTSRSCGATPGGLAREGVAWAYWDISDIAVR